MTLDDHIAEMTTLRARIGHGSLEVMFQYQSGDYWRTEISQAVTGGAVGYVAPLTYHGAEKPVVVEEEDFLEKQRLQAAIEECAPSEVDEEGHTGVMADGNKEIMQVVLLSAY